MTRYLRAAGVVAVGAALAIGLRRVDLHEIGAALAGAKLGWFVVAIAVNALGRTAARARRTYLLLGRRRTFAEVVRLGLAGYAASALLPGPAEDLVCCAQLARGRRLSWREIARYQLTDKALGAISIALVALVLLPATAALATVALAAIAIGRRELLVPLGWLVVSNVLCIAMIALCCCAVGGQMTPAGCAQVFLATSLTTALPLVPGQIGTLEAAFAIAARHAGVAAPVALAAAILYHVAQVAPTTIAGLPPLLRMSWEPQSC